MSKEKKTIPELRFPEFKNDGEWVKNNLGNHIDLFSGIALKSEEMSDDESGTPILRGINITEGFIRHTKDIDKYFLGEIEILEKYFVKENDIVIGMDGSKVGKNVALIGKKDENSILIQRVARIRANKNAHIHFVYQYFISDKFRSYVDKVNTSSGIPHISAQQIKDFKVDFPPKIQEQQKIAYCLSSLDKVIAGHRQKLTLLKEHKKGLMQNLFPQEGEKVPKYRFKEFEHDGEWVEKKLGEVCNMQAGKFVSASEIKDQFSEDLFPCYGGNGLRGFTKSYTHTGTYSLIGRQGALCGNITLVDGRFHATEHAVVVTPEKGVDNVWLFHMLKLMNLNQYATGQAQPGLSVGNLEQVELNIPTNPKEQQKIASCLSSLDELITAQAEKIEQLQLHKKGLMQELFPKITE